MGGLATHRVRARPFTAAAMECAKAHLRHPPMPIRHALFLVVGCAVLAGAAAQHPRYDTYSGFAVDTTAVLPAAEVHPSLYFTADRIDTLRARKADTQSPYYVLWQRFRGDALRFRGADMAQLDENDRPRAAKTLAFWWIIEEDTVAARKAIEALLLAWDGVPQTGQKPYDEIYRATWLQNYAAAYDWVHDRLRPDQDSLIRQHIAAETQFLRDNLMDGDRLAPRPHNHRSKPAWAIGTAALVLSDHAQAADWLRFSLYAANTVTRYQFSEDGIYREGGHYWMYNAVNMIPFLWHYRNVSGVDLFLAYRPAFEWPIRVRTGRGQIPNVEDSYLKPAPTHMVAAAYRGVPTTLNPGADFAALCQWNYQTTRVIDPDYTGATVDVTWEIDEYILYDDTIAPAAPSGPENQFLVSGQVVFRHGWVAAPNDRYLLFHGVAEGDNHNHPDQLSFFLAANDAILIPDAGYGPQGFSDDRRSSWYTTARAHNIVTADGYPPVSDLLFTAPYVYNVMPPSRYHMDAPFFAFAEKESAYLRPQDALLRRAIGFVDRDYFVVADVVTGTTDHVYRAYLHGRGYFQRDGHYAAWEPFENRYGGVARLDAYFFPTTTGISHATGWVSLFKDERYERYVEVEQTGQNAVFLQLLLPAGIDDAAPEATDLSTQSFAAANLARGDTADWFLLQHAQEPQVLDSFATDATLMWMRRRGGAVHQMAIREASTLESGALKLAAGVPATMALDLRDDTALRIAVPEDHPAAQLELEYPGADMVQEVHINGEPVSFSRQGGRLVIGFGVTNIARDRIADRSGPLQVYPNPFSREVTIAAPGHGGQRFTVEIYNTLGQRVRQIRGAAGARRVLWDGRTDGGIPLASGLYFLRWLDASGAAHNGRVLRIGS